VLATGYELFDATKLGSYGVGLVPDVIDGLAFERLLSASGPTSGEVKRPSDGKTPKKIVFVQCAGSRDSTAACPTARRYAACTPPSRPFSTTSSARWTGDNLLHRRADSGQGVRGILQARDRRQHPVPARQGFQDLTARATR